MNQRKQWMRLKHKLIDIALNALPEILDRLTELVESDEIITLTELITTGERLTNKLRLRSYLPNYSDSDTKYQNQRTHPFNQNAYYSKQFPNPNKNGFNRQGSFGKSNGDSNLRAPRNTQILQRPPNHWQSGPQQGQPDEFTQSNYRHQQFSPGPTRKLISTREIGNPFRTDDQRRMQADAREIDDFISREHRQAEQRVQATQAIPNQSVQNHVNAQPGLPNSQLPSSYEYLHNARNQNYAIENEEIEINGQWDPISQLIRHPHYHSPARSTSTPYPGLTEDSSSNSRKT